jgi:hypothetical protein
MRKYHLLNSLKLMKTEHVLSLVVNKCKNDFIKPQMLPLIYGTILSPLQEAHDLRKKIFYFDHLNLENCSSLLARNSSYFSYKNEYFLFVYKFTPVSTCKVNVSPHV